MSRIWRYVLAHDTGMAPCLEGGTLTLACCKPDIRRSARRGEWVIGFAPKATGHGRVAWVGQVAEVLPLGEYEARFRGRRDALYRSDGDDRLVPVQEIYHADQRSRQRDLRGRNALIFNPFWYWGRNTIAAPDAIASMAHYYVGQSARGSTPDRIACLEAWTRSAAHPGIHGDPRQGEPRLVADL